MKIAYLFLSFIILISIVFAQPDPVPDPDPHRFDDAINSFMKWDKKNSVPEDVILFVGSSSIRLWMTADAFPDFTVINRGFGGAHISDINFFIENTVLKYSPKTIVFYAGDNDIAGNKIPDQVLDDYKIFVQKVIERRYDTKILYIPIKPSIARWQYWEAMKRANEMIKEYSDSENNLFYVDTASPMLDWGTPPPSNLFIEDGLHLSEEGYQMWNDILMPVLHQETTERVAPSVPQGIKLE